MPLHTAISMVRNDQGHNGIIGDFETVASCLISYSSVAKRKTIGKKRGTSISESSVEASFSSALPKQSMGNTGSHFRWHKIHESKNLSKEQKEELFECSKYLKGKGGKKRVKFVKDDQKFSQITV